MTGKPRLLLVDDGDAYAKVLRERMPEFELVHPDSKTDCLPDGPAALSFLAKHARKVDLVLLDMHFDVADDRLLPLAADVSIRRLKRFQGVAILREIRARFPDLPVVLLTSVEDLSLVDAAGELAAQSMTYFLDSDDLDSLRIRINAALRDASLGLEESQILWGKSRTMRRVRGRLAVLARGRMPVIVEGETGTGKSFLAREFVHANADRTGPFVTIDLSAIPENLVSAELFGARKGAYTGATADRRGAFEAANGGTLFLDEVQNVPLDVQKQLLVVLQEGRVRPLGAPKDVAVDVKVVAASNTPLDRAVAEGRFRHDLYMRLSPATRVVIPPLRERKEDLLFLAHRFLAKAVEEPDIRTLSAELLASLGMADDTPAALQIGRPKKSDTSNPALVLSLPRPAWRMFESHDWPGNVRELAMVMRNLLAFTLVAAVDAIRSGMSMTAARLQVDTGLVGDLLAAARIPGPATDAPDGFDGRDPASFAGKIGAGESLSEVAAGVERQYFLHLFEHTRGDFRRMAETLLGDPERHRAVRLRFNQLGLKVRELRRR